MTKFHFAFPALVAAMALTAASQAGVYKTIAIDGKFTDWADVPDTGATSVNTGTPIDFASLKMANDDNYIYFLITFNTAVNPQTGDGTYLAIDSDNLGTTGYHVFGNPAIGSNVGFQNDFPFTQSADPLVGFNTNGTVTGATFSASPYATSTLQQEVSIPLSATQTDTSSGGYTGPIFKSSFTVEFYSDLGAGDTLGPVRYALASSTNAPEPATLGLAAIVAGGVLRRWRATIV